MNSLKILSNEEFADLMTSKTIHKAKSQAVYPMDNVFPPIDRTTFTLSKKLVFSVFDSMILRAKVQMEHQGKTAPTMISAGLMDGTIVHATFLNWLTLAMAQSHQLAFTEHLVPRTQYIRPRAFWTTVGEKARPSIRLEETPTQFSRMFQWHILDSKTFADSKILLAVVTTWSSITSAPTSWGYWTYIRKDGTRQPFSGLEQYNKEVKEISIETRLRSFDPQGSFRNSHFMVVAEAYNHLSLGQFIALMFSMEFHPEHYSSVTLDAYVDRFINKIILAVSVEARGVLKPLVQDTVDHSQVIRSLLYGMSPLVNMTFPPNESSFATSTGELAFGSPYGYAVTPEDLFTVLNK